MIDCGSLERGAVGGLVGNADVVARALCWTPGHAMIDPVKYAELPGRDAWPMHGAALVKVGVVAMALGAWTLNSRTLGFAFSAG